MEGSTTLGSSALDGTATATFATSALPDGTHNITAVYAGDLAFAGSTSTALDQVVSAPVDFILGASPASATIQAGEAATFTITATAQNGFNGPITLACSSTATPSFSTCEFSANPVTPGASPATSTLTIKTTANTANSLPDRGKHSSLFYAVWLLVPGMVLVSMRSGAQDRKRFFNFALVFLLMGGCLFQTACGMDKKTTQGNGTPPGSYIVIVTATSGGTQNTVPLTLTVQ